MTTSVLDHVLHVDAKPRASAPALLRSLLIAGCALAMTAAAVLGDPSASLRSDPELAQLLRGMALLKSLLVVASIAVLLWRVGHPLPGALATGYLAGVYLMAGATILIWQLSWLLAAAATFHVGALIVLVAAWRDDGGRCDLLALFPNRSARR